MVDDRLGRPARAAAMAATLALALSACAEALNDAANGDDGAPQADASAPHGDATTGAHDGATPPYPARDAGIDASPAPDAGPAPPDDAAPPPPQDSAPPLPTCTKNADCPGFLADAGPDGDVRIMCMIPGCTGGGQCVPTFGCDPSPNPWCGCDGVTYPDVCAAIRAGVSLATTCDDDAGSP